MKNILIFIDSEFSTRENIYIFKEIKLFLWKKNTSDTYYSKQNIVLQSIFYIPYNAEQHLLTHNLYYLTLIIIYTFIIGSFQHFIEVI